MRKHLILPAAVAAMALMACPSNPPETDDIPTKPGVTAIPPDIEVKDQLNVGLGDKVDWKKITSFDTGKGQLNVIVGDPFAGAHGMTGEVGVYAKSGPPALAKQAITPGEHNYDLEFEAEADETYLFQIMAQKTTAATPYKVTFKVEEPPPSDPCAEIECDEETQECQDGACVDLPDPDVCEPACSRRQVCVNGSCEKPCGGGCDRGEYCHKSKNECRKDPCFGKKCATGEKCRYGRCVPTVKVGCSPACGDGEKCVGSTCKKVEAGAPPEPSGGPVAATIVQVIPQGKKTVLVLNKGKTHGVKRGATGKVSGVAGVFTITEVYAFRSKAVIAVDDKALGNNRRASINK